MRILVVEDDAALARVLGEGLGRMGLTVEHAAGGRLAEAMLAVRYFDALILDLGLPDLSGLDVLRHLRARNKALPVLILTARDAVSDRVAGLDAGADDYLVKPFDFTELEARLRALFRRSEAARHGRVTFGRLGFEMHHRQAFVDQTPLALSARETAVLELLIQRAGRVVSKEALLDHLAQTTDVGENAIEVYVHRLRKKLVGSGVSVRTLRGLGYLLDHEA